MARNSICPASVLSAQTDCDGNREWSTKRELAHRYGVSIRCIDNWVYQGRIPSIKVGRVIRFHVARCDQALTCFERKETR